MEPRYIDPTLLEQAEKAGITVMPGDWPYEREVTVNNLRFHYLDWGPRDAPIVLFLHGGAQTAHMWDFSALALRDRYRCICLDQRGHGQSEWAPDADYSNQAHQGDLEAFVETLGLAPFTVVGLSMGGVNAFVLASNHHDWVQRLVIVDIGPESGKSGVSQIRTFIQLPDELDSYEEFVERVKSYQPYRSSEQISASLKHNVTQMANGKWTWRYDKAFRDPEGFKHRSSPKELWQAIERINCPTLIVRGEGSRIFPAEVADRMAKILPQATLVTVEKAGHRVPGDNPSVFEKTLVHFLDGSPS